MTEKAGDYLVSAKDAVLAHPVATLIVDSQQIIVEANAAAENLFNLARSHLVGTPLLDMLKSTEIPLGRIFDGDGKSFAAYDLHLRAGRSPVRSLDILISPAHHENGHRLVALPQGSETGSAGRRPGSPARSATGAAAMLAHEIKNPLSGIRGAAQLMEQATGEDATRFAQLICAEVDRIAALIDAMQNFTREQPLRLNLENIYPAIEQARSIAKAGFAKDIPIHEHYDPSLPAAMISHDGLVQILINLIKNASEAMVGTQSPMIRLTTAFRHGLSYDADDGRGRIALPVEINVIDNGPGVPEALVDDMFSPFVTGRGLDEGGHHGQGLGLAMVDKLVREMGGLVRYHRDGALGLSCFRIHLPIMGVHP